MQKKYYLLFILFFIGISSYSQNIIYNKIPTIGTIKDVHVLILKSNTEYTIRTYKNNVDTPRYSFSISPLDLSSFINGMRENLRQLGYPYNDSTYQEGDLLAIYTDIQITNMDFEDEEPNSGTIYFPSSEIAINRESINKYKLASLKKSYFKRLMLSKSFYKHYVKDSLKVMQYYGDKEDTANAKRKIESAKDKIKKLKEDSLKSITNWYDDSVGVIIGGKQESQKLKIQYVQIEFLNGMLENIIVKGIVKNNSTDSAHVLFRNNYPVSFTSLNDYGLISSIKLFNYLNDSVTASIALSDIMRYEPSLSLNSRDYSPADQVLLKIPRTSVELKKEQTSEIVKARIYSDLVGLKSSNPNGLIQTEISKRVLLWTRRLRLWPFEEKFATLGLFNSTEPFVSLTKLEDNNKYEFVHTRNDIIDNNLLTTRYVSTLDLLRFQNFNTGINTNVSLFDCPSVKSTIYLNYVFQFGRTGVQDYNYVLDINNAVVKTNEIVQFNLNSIQNAFEIVWKIKPDPRYGFSFLWKLSSLILADKDVVSVSNISEFERSADPGSTYISTFQIAAFIRTSSLQPSKNTNQKGELFFRFNYNSLGSNYQENYFQAQLGYSFYLLKKK
jgi:hypothetical protein